jgi:hypothetical protein
LTAKKHVEEGFHYLAEQHVLAFYSNFLRSPVIPNWCCDCSFIGGFGRQDFTVSNESRPACLGARPAARPLARPPSVESTALKTKKKKKKKKKKKARKYR